jgi:hypothetical protein
MRSSPDTRSDASRDHATVRRVGFDPARRYPVVYLLHGMPGSPSEYLYGTQLLQYADGQQLFPSLRGEWRDQLDAGLSWSFG